LTLYNILIIGYGSAGKKHHYVLKKLLNNVKYFALRSKKSNKEISGVKNIFDFNEIKEINFDFIIISNPTKFHNEALKQALYFECPIFIEKPVLYDLELADEFINTIKDKKIITYVACNLRFNKTIVKLKELLKLKTVGKIYEVSIYCGSNVSEWRPNQDKSDLINTVNLSGGVNIDLIHELDYAYWFFGLPIKVNLFTKKVSDLEIDVPDYANFILDYKFFPVNVSLNYFRNDYKRTVEIVGSKGTIYADLSLNQIKLNDNIIFSENVDDIYYTYYEQMKYFINVIKKKKQSMNTILDGVDVLKIGLGKYNGNIKK